LADPGATIYLRVRRTRSNRINAGNGISNAAAINPVLSAIEEEPVLSAIEEEQAAIAGLT
jgi:hypothetical protein